MEMETIVEQKLNLRFLFGGNFEDSELTTDLQVPFYIYMPNEGFPLLMSLEDITTDELVDIYIKETNMFISADAGRDVVEGEIANHFIYRRRFIEITRDDYPLTLTKAIALILSY